MLKRSTLRSAKGIELEYEADVIEYGGVDVIHVSQTQIFLKLNINVF